MTKRTLRNVAALSCVVLVGLVIALKNYRIKVPADFIIPQQPPRTPLASWQSSDGREAVHTTLDGVELRGFRYPGTNPAAPAILFFYGNGSTASGFDSFSRELAGLGPTVMVYDYRGYGFSGGKTHLATYLQDGLAIYDQLSKTGKVIVYGASMGTTVASYIASQRPVAGLILGMPIASAEEEGPVYLQQAAIPNAIASRMVPSAEATRIFGEAAELQHYTGPLLVLEGTRDTLVPMIQGRHILEASASTQKSMAIVEGADHNEVVDSSTAMQAVAKFLHEL